MTEKILSLIEFINSNELSVILQGDLCKIFNDINEKTFELEALDALASFYAIPYMDKKIMDDYIRDVPIDKYFNDMLQGRILMGKNIEHLMNYAENTIREDNKSTNFQTRYNYSLISEHVTPNNYGKKEYADLGLFGSDSFKNEYVSSNLTRGYFNLRLGNAYERNSSPYNESLPGEVLHKYGLGKEHRGTGVVKLLVSWKKGSRVNRADYKKFDNNTIKSFDSKVTIKLVEYMGIDISQEDLKLIEKIKIV